MLESVEFAIERVNLRVKEGGHNIPKQVITRRYFSGLSNLFKIFIPIADYWMIYNNSKSPSQLIAEGYANQLFDVKNQSVYDTLKIQSGYDKRE